MLSSFEKTAFLPADILIPEGLDMTKWSVVACDQYTSQPQYWKQVEAFVGDAPSSLGVVFPEIYLEDDDYHVRILKINQTMAAYLESGIFRTQKDAFVYVERTLANGKVRKGVIGMVDLEAYDYTSAAKSLVRATEKTVVERIPPRIKVRIDAPVELPHIMLLIDDPEQSAIEPYADKKAQLEAVYDFELMQGGGHIKGYLVPKSDADGIAKGLEKLRAKSDLLFAVGDGNHSLATAKECWELTKKQLSPNEIKSHPARYALAEMVNIHDESLEFEPIHRVLFGVDPKDVLDALANFYNVSDSEGQRITYTFGGKQGEVFVKNPPYTLPLGTLQHFLDDYVAKKSCKIDYIHGDDVVEALSAEAGNMGFFLPAMQKSELFPSVVSDGVLPRKTFSMGEAADKRFYLEARKIK